MSDINTVLERLITDPGFRQQIKEDPKAALTPYDLNEADLELLATQISDEKGSESAVETRTSKSALAGLLGLFGGGGSAQTQSAETDLDFVSRPAGPDPTTEIDEYGSVKPKFLWDTEHDAESGKVAETDLNFEPESEEAVDHLFKLGQVKGEAQDHPIAAGKDHDKWVDVQSMSPPVHKPGGGASTEIVDDLVGSTTDPTAEKALQDLEAVKDGLGPSPETPADIADTAPEPSDGDVDGRDFLVWQRNFGDDAGGESNKISLEDPPGDEQDPQAYLKDTDEPSAQAIELENAQITSYQLGALDESDAPDVGDEIVGNADDQTADDPHKDEIQILSYAWGETNDAAVGGDESKTVGSNRPDPVGISEIQDGTSNTMALGEVAGGDPDQPLIVGSVPNDASDPGLQSDGELVQAVSEGDAAKGTGDLAIKGSKINENSEKGEDVATVQELLNDDPGRSDDLQEDGLVGPKTEPEKEIEGTDVSTGSYVGAEPIGDELPEDPPTDD